MNTPNILPARPLVALVMILALALGLSACGKQGAKEVVGAKGDGHADHADEKKGKSADKADKTPGKEEHAEGEKELTLTSDEAARAGIKVEEIKAQVQGESLVVTATIHPNQERVAKVSARIPGRITSAPAKLGDRVRAGQVLATLESVEVGEAHAAGLQAQAELRIAEADFKRAELLNAEEIIPRKDFLRAQADRDKANAAVRTTADRLRLLGGAPAAAGSPVAGFTVSAPFAGVVVEKTLTVGGLANPSDPLFTVADLSQVWIQAALPEVALAKVRLGANAEVSVMAYPGQIFKGKVGHIGALLDKETRTVAARIEVANADGRLKPEMFATATITVAGDTRQVISLPDEAIVLLDGQPNVFVFDAGAYEARQVEPGDRIAGRTLLKSGVKPGDQVVTSGAYALKARKLKSQLGHGH
jgi:cobalt-zinc-cadmium efflux system membrane fusion protein